MPDLMPEAAITCCAYVFWQGLADITVGFNLMSALGHPCEYSPAVNPGGGASGR
jgi:hypothetical protein